MKPPHIIMLSIIFGVLVTTAVSIRRPTNLRPPAPCSSTNSFLCPTGSQKCIPKSWTCDDDSDCDGGEDEENCNKDNPCNKGEFTCDGGDDSVRTLMREPPICLPNKWRCDGEFDCNDQSDEKDCSTVTCKADQFKCPEYDGQFTLCIPQSWQCDGHRDCADGADEQNCTQNSTCSAHDFKCRNGVCVFASWRCDGEDDCGDGSDEDETMCKISGVEYCRQKNLFKCASSVGCIPAEWRCDGESDCRDHSDEANCTETAAKPAVCHPRTEFACHTGVHCVNRLWVCDGESDCPDASDESNCETKECAKGEKRCNGSSGMCFPESFWCNGAEECPGGEDEQNCPSSNQTVVCDELNEFTCPGEPLRCVPLAKLCTSSQMSCGDDSTCSKDIKQCAEKSDSCDCRSSYVKGAKICVCKPGYRSVNGACEDINECNEIPGACDQLCFNRPGTYRCGCHPHYKLSLEKRGTIPSKCRALGGDPVVLLSNRATIRQFDIVTNVHHPLVQSPGSAVAMDFHRENNTIIWSDISAKRIIMCKISNTTKNSWILDGKACSDASNQYTVFEGDVHTPDGLAIDWVHNLLFWTDGGLDQINVMNLDTKQKKILFTDELEEPRAIAVDPELGLIFWTDWGVQAKIERAGMDGSHRTTIVQGDHVKWPNGLALDLLDKRVYWADAKIKSIFSADYYGQDVRTVLHSHAYLKHPFSLSVFEDRVYFTDWEHDGVITVNKFTGGDVQKIMSRVNTPMTVRIYHEQAQPPHSNKCWLPSSSSSPCAESRICLPTAAIKTTSREDEKKQRYSGKPFSCVCLGGIGDNLGDTAECLADVLTGSRGFSLSTMLFFLILAGLLAAGFAFYRHRAQNRFTMLNFDNPIYRRTVEPHELNMDDPFRDPFGEEGIVTVGGPTQVLQPPSLQLVTDSSHEVSASAFDQNRLIQNNANPIA